MSIFDELRKKYLFDEGISDYEIDINDIIDKTENEIEQEYIKEGFISDFKSGINEPTPQMSNTERVAGAVVSGGLGAISSVIATKKREEAIKILKAKMKECKTKDCRKKYTEVINKYQDLVNHKYKGIVKRTVGGIVAGGLTGRLGPAVVGAYHTGDSMHRNSELNKLNKESE